MELRRKRETDTTMKDKRERRGPQPVEEREGRPWGQMGLGKGKGNLCRAALLFKNLFLKLQLIYNVFVSSVQCND